jgi:3-phenylpropionate/cinnamic acid dioxygenase small subunit
MTTWSDEQVRAAVTETLLDYAELVDTCEPDRWADLFCEDGAFDEGTVVEGRENLRVHVRKLLRLFDATAHHISNIRVRRTGAETADASCYVYAWHRRTNGEDFELWGRYTDRLRVEDGRWKFASRRVELFGSRGWDVTLDRVPRGSTD